MEDQLKTPQAEATDTKRGLGYFPAVDGLRAAAVVAVLLFHLTEKSLPGGFVGVDIFFVISGFVVTASIAHMRFDTLPSFLAYFYARRITRIFPALCVCLVVTGALYTLFIPQAWLSTAMTRVGLAAFFGAGNVVLATDNNTYFSPAANFNPFTHTWSLGVEEQFYLLFPFLLFAFSRSGGSRVWRRRIILAIVTLCFVSLATSAALTIHQWRQAFYMLPSRFWELGCGMLLCLTIERWRHLLLNSARISSALSIASAAIIAVALFLPSSTGFPFPLALLPVLGAAGLIVVSVARPTEAPAKILSAGPVVFLGKISYSLYLWHWPVLVLLRWTTGLNSWFESLLAVCVTFGISLLSYFFIEQPFRQLRRSGPPWIVVAAGVATICILAYCTRDMFGHKNSLTFTRTRDFETWYSNAPFSCTVNTAMRDNGEFQTYVFMPSHCPTPAPPGSLIVAGDSHAGAYWGVFSRFAQETGREVKVYTLPGCSFLPLYEPAAPKCLDLESAVSEDLAKTVRPQDVIFLPSLRMPRFVEEWGEAQNTFYANIDAPALRAMVDKETADVMGRISVTGAHIVFEGPTPIFKSPPFRCADWFNAKNPICAEGFTVDRAELEARRAPAVNAIRGLVESRPNVSLWDPFPILCPGSRCNAFMDGKPLFFDGDHLSGYGNQVLYPFFREAMDVYWEPDAVPPSTRVP